MFDVIVHASPMPPALHGRPKRYFAAAGEEPPAGMVRMSEEELRGAIADTDEAWQTFMSTQARESPALPDVFLRSPSGNTFRLVISDVGKVTAEPVE